MTSYNTLAQRKRRLKPEAREKDRAYTELYHQTHKEEEQVKRHNKYYNRETWGASVLPYLRDRAKRKNLDCDLEPSDIVIPDVCPVLGIPLIIGTGDRAKTAYSSPSVDRYDNSKGYTKDNIRVISHRANALKSDASLEELRAVVKYMGG